MNVEEAEKKLGELGLSTRAQSKTGRVATISISLLNPDDIWRSVASASEKSYQNFCHELIIVYIWLWQLRYQLTIHLDNIATAPLRDQMF